MIALVTGEIGSGKTTVCERLLKRLRARGLRPRGILCPARLDTGGRKVGIDALDVATGERRHLAVRAPGRGRTTADYTFDPAALRWAAGRLQAAATTTPDLLVVDEIGPLELVRGQGFAPVLDPLSDPNHVPRGLVVVRRAYVDALAERLGRPDLACFWVNEASRERLPLEIIEAFA